MYGNKSQMSWKPNSRTFIALAPCGVDWGQLETILRLMSAYVGLVSTITNHPNLAPIRSDVTKPIEKKPEQSLPKWSSPVDVRLDARLAPADELGVPEGEPAQHQEAARRHQRLEEHQRARRQQRETGRLLGLLFNHQLLPHDLERAKE